MDFLFYVIMPFLVLVISQITTDANDAFGSLNIFVANIATWSFTDFVNALLHFTVAFCFAHKLSM